MAPTTMPGPPGSRLLRQVPAYTGGFGTEYSYSETGEIASVAERIVGGSKTGFASDFEYEPFGPLSGFDLAVTIPQPYGSATLRMGRTYREDYALDRLEWVATPSSGFDPPISFLDQSFSYSPAGLLTARIDSASTFDSRHYGYDALMRLTCEARGDGSGQPSAADCVPSSTRLAGLYSYNDGAGSTTPPDTRATSHVPSYAVGANTYLYAGGAGAILSHARAGSTPRRP